jgi:hypothetical protein
MKKRVFGNSIIYINLKPLTIKLIAKSKNKSIEITNEVIAKPFSLYCIK